MKFSLRLLLLFACALFGACSAEDSQESDPDSSTDADTDSDSDGDTDSDSSCMLGTWNGTYNILVPEDLEGIANYTEITGFLYINCPTCTSLEALTCLTTVGGELEVESTLVTDLSGLENVTSIGSWLLIGTNLDLLSIAALESLATIGGEINYYENYQSPYCDLCDLLDQLVDFTGQIWVYANLADDCCDDSCLDEDDLICD